MVELTNAEPGQGRHRRRRRVRDESAIQDGACGIGQPFGKGNQLMGTTAAVLVMPTRWRLMAGGQIGLLCVLRRRRFTRDQRAGSRAPGVRED